MKFFKDRIISPKARIISSVPLAEISMINLNKISMSKEVLVIKDNVIPTHEIESLLKQVNGCKDTRKKLGKIALLILGYYLT
ncbi:MAG: hypothetical protein GNW80_06825 [Asgard group archaeon]|nr:hypothetical protein [Asgard group archaeon]